MTNYEDDFLIKMIRLQEIIKEANKMTEQDIFEKAKKNKIEITKFRTYAEYGEDTGYQEENDESGWNIVDQVYCKQCGNHKTNCICCLDCLHYPCICEDGGYEDGGYEDEDEDEDDGYEDDGNEKDDGYEDDGNEKIEIKLGDIINDQDAFQLASKILLPNKEQQMFNNIINKKLLEQITFNNVIKEANKMTEDQNLFNKLLEATKKNTQNEFEKNRKLAKVINGDITVEDFAKEIPYYDNSSQGLFEAARNVKITSDQDLFNGLKDDTDLNKLDGSLDWREIEADFDLDYDSKNINITLYCDINSLPRYLFTLSDDENVKIPCEFLNNGDILIVHKAIINSKDGFVNDGEIKYPGLVMTDRMNGNMSVVGAVLVENGEIEISKYALEKAGFTKPTLSVIQLGNGDYGFNGFYLR